MRRFSLVMLVCLVVAAPGFAATDPYLEKTLKAQMVKKFKTVSPKLKISKVTCVLPKSGITSTCKAYFSENGVTGYIPVMATIHDSGKVSWSTSTPYCLDTKTKKYVSCSS